MNHRVNSVLHFLSACYWALVTTAPRAVYSSSQARAWAGIALFGLDLLAAAKQWESATAQRALSITLHFVTAVVVTSLVLSEYLQTEPTPFSSWLQANNYLFIATLAIMRLCAGTALLLYRKGL